jgi:glycosyltransferase involved in cell wall biosynthesis
MFAGLRHLDVRAARRVDQYVAGSKAVAERIRLAYGIEAPVVYPPVDVSRFQPQPGQPNPEPQDWYIVVSRLVPHKRIDLAVQAFTEMQRPLKIVGEGRAAEWLKAQAGPTIEFLGWRSDDDVADLLRQSRGLILPGVEDFGITAVEAQAAGRPVIAFDGGGARETVINGVTGLFFREPTVASLCEAIQQADHMAWDPDRARAHAAQFSIERFQREITSIVTMTIARAAGERLCAD